MAITTKQGDRGHTRTIFGGMLEKSHPVIGAVGDADELNAVLGLVRQHLKRPDIREVIARAQEDLVGIMGMISAGAAGAERYQAQGFRTITHESVNRLTVEAAALEAEFPQGFRSWSVPGASGDAGSAWLEMARTVCRRAERSIMGLPAAEMPPESPLPAWFNRLSDLLWLAARCEESPAGPPVA